MYHFCGVISEKKPAKCQNPLADENSMNFGHLEAMADQVSTDTQAMIGQFDRQQSAVRQSEAICFENGTQVELLSKMVTKAEDITSDLEEDVAAFEMLIDSLASEVSLLEDMNNASNPEELESERNEQTLKLAQLMIDIKIKIDSMYKMLQELQIPDSPISVRINHFIQLFRKTEQLLEVLSLRFNV